MLADWIKAKFNVEMDLTAMETDSVSEILEAIHRGVDEAYKQREIRYPIENAINRAFAEAGTDNIYALQQIVRWANLKYNVGWTAERFENKPLDFVAQELMAAREQFIDGGGLEKEVDAALAKHQASENGELLQWAEKRFGRALNAEALKTDDNDPRDVLLDAGRQLTRWELTQLERYVLLRIYDQSWKDHLLEMDHLKHAIMQRPLGGDQTHPQSQFAIEGRDQFNQMWQFIRDRVTDMIFKVSTAAPESDTSTQSQSMQMHHQSSTGAGFAQAAADEAAAMRAQGEAAKAKTIRREEPKVGRNDPCPCGSGKKYKQCHGKK
jgi:preprotein translocase subunit SecA